MRHLNKLASVFTAALMGLMILSGCEGGDTFDVNSPDWISAKIDSIENSKKTGTEEELTGMMDDVYTIGKTDYSSGWWSEFSKYYVIADGQKWNAQFNLNINPDENTVYYKNFAIVITNDVDRGGNGYTEYGAFRFDATGDSVAYNSQWGTDLYFKYSNSNLLLSPDANNIDKNVQKLGGKVTLTVDRSKPDTFAIKITNGAVTKTLVQPWALRNLNSDAANTNIRCFIAVEGSYINFLSTNIEPIGGCTSAEDKNPVSMVLNNIPDEVNVGTPIDSALQNISATVTFEEGVTKEVPASELLFYTDDDMNTEGQKSIHVIYNKTFKGEKCDKPILANTTVNSVQQIASIEVTAQPARTQYYYFDSPATADLTDRAMAFDPTGLEVTATYVSGTKAVIDNSKLTFSAVGCTNGSHDVTISTKNGKTATVKVNVSESEEVDVTPTPATVGNADNTTAWWTAFSDDINIPSGKTYACSFTNYSGANNWNNFVVILRNKALEEYGVVRADNYGWGNGYDAAKLSGGQADWAAWLAAMNGAKVTLYITNCNNGTADIQAVMEGIDGNMYVQYYLGINTIEPNDLQFSLTVDSSHLIFNSNAAKVMNQHNYIRK